MKRISLTVAYLFLCRLVIAQNWTAVSFPSNMVWQADTLGTKLYIAQGADNGIYEWDGTTWTLLNNYNNSFNTQHKSKSAVKNIDGLLYLGARDFNTSGEGDVHTYDGSNFVEKQVNNIPYNGTRKIHVFEKYLDTVYMCGYDVFYKWDGTDWTSANFPINVWSGTPEWKCMTVYQNKLYAGGGNKLGVYDGISWDSLPFLFSPSFNDLAVYNNKLYIAGGATLIMDTAGGNYNAGMLVTWDGTTLTAANFPYYLINHMYADNQYLYAIVQKVYQGDVYLVRFDGTSWTDVAFLAAYNTGVIPGYELYDYYRIVPFKGDLYVGGRFAQIGGQQIQSFARFSGTPLNTPAAPTNLAAVVQKTDDTNVHLTWQDNANNETGFVIERSTDGLTYNPIDTVAPDVQAVNDFSIAAYTNYYYRVYAFNGDGNSANSNLAVATTGFVGLEELPLSTVQVYPNPATELLHLQGLPANTTVRLLDIRGAVVMQQTGISGQANLILSDLPIGVYYAQLISSTGMRAIAVTHE